MSYRLTFVLPALCVISRGNLHQMVTCFAVFYTIKLRKLFYASLSTSLPFLITPQTTPSIFTANYSLPLRGGAGGEASFALHHFTFNYQSRHPHTCFTTQLGTSCSFDSPGLARNEPTPGERSQGDSTP